MTDPAGNTVAWASAGTAGFKGSRQSTPYAAQLAAQQAARGAQANGMREVDVFIKGPGRRDGNHLDYRCDAYSAQWVSSAQETKGLVVKRAG
jgi:hypothetical protein